MKFFIHAVLTFALVATALAGPSIDPRDNVMIPAGKSLIIPVTASSSNGRPLTFTATSSTNRITVEVHTNNPFWKMTVAQAAPANAPGAFQTPFRGGNVSVTNIGDMTFMLFRDLAPHTVDVIQGLTASSFYSSNTIFHRIVPGFVIQGGDPETNGLGGPVFRYDDEFSPDAIFSGNGQLALANSGKDTDGSQFFVTAGTQRSLDFGYTLFGQLLRGFNVLTNVINTPADTNSRPLADVIITRASFVPDNFDTVLTLTATNLAGVAGTIRVIADDGVGGRATNSFIATTAADPNSEPAFLYPNTVTNLVAPMNKRLTNLVTGYDFPGITNNWYVQYADLNSSLNATNSFDNIVSNQLEIVVVPNTNYASLVSLILYVSASPAFASYDQQKYTFVFGDTRVVAQAIHFTVPALTAFTNRLLATFTNGVPDSDATNFTAFINWGDNVTNSGVILANADGFKEVRGSHTYTNAGDYPVYITIQSYVGASATVVSTASVPPSITFSRIGADNVLRWPGWATDYQLQSTTNIAGPDWSAVSEFPSLNGYDNVLTNNTPDGALFFRLKQ
jgi:cyclophilin family peptidyl-prolyl cis-trans isomerase